VKRPRAGASVYPRDVGVFVRGTLSDMVVRRALAGGMTPAQAFDHLYTKDADPWRSASPAYRYQHRKHQRMLALLPERRFARALDLGCGPGLFTRLLSARSDQVLGVDISAVALAAARRHCTGLPGVTFSEGDITTNGPWVERAAFDLVVLADTIYYLPTPIADATLKDVAGRAARLLVPGGLLLLVNQYFTPWDPDSRFSARIETAFAWSAAFEPVARRRHNFWLGTVLERTAR
jgi:SAM-dependent methyltransferase